MKIYVLKGHAERGKTTTLKQVALNLASAYADAEIIYSEQKLTFDKIKKQVALEKRERRAQNIDIETERIALVMRANGKTVGIFSDGDYEKDIADAVNMFEEYSCDVAFGVCRSKGITIKLYEDMHHEVCFVEKAEVRNAREYEKFNDYIEKLNEWQANELASLV